VGEATIGFGFGSLVLSRGKAAIGFGCPLVVESGEAATGFGFPPVEKAADKAIGSDFPVLPLLGSEVTLKVTSACP